MEEIVEILKSEIEYFKKLKDAIGGIHGHIHSLAVKISKIHLTQFHPDISEWTTEEKFGAGIDILGKDSSKTTIVAAEVKTTSRVEKENLGSPQRRSVKKDIAKLDSTGAKYKYLCVIDNKNKKAIEGILRNSCVENIKLINIFDE